MSNDKLSEAVNLIQSIIDDTSSQKNIKAKMQSVINILKEDSENSIKVNKSLSALDEIANDNNIDQYIRTQIYNIVSILENVN
jgi:uncharacterized protein (UPF0147 family)